MATNITRIVLKDFNRDLIREELQAVQADIGIILKGFDKGLGGIFTVSTGTKKIGQTVNNGVLTEFFAEPGDLSVRTQTSFTPSEEAQIDSLLAAHDSTGISSNQASRNQDEIDLDVLETNLTEWDSLSQGQKFNSVKRLLRIVLRRERGAII